MKKKPLKIPLEEKGKMMLKKPVRYVLSLIGFILFFLSVSLTVSGISMQKSKVSKSLYNYRTESELSYLVKLYNNSYIPEGTLGENEAYISDLVDTIEATFNYYFSGSNIIPLDYEYDIKATISGEYKLNDENSTTKLWTKEYTLLPRQTKTLSENSQLIINETADIDYSVYDKAVSDFRQELKLAITAKLTVAMNVKVNGEVDGEKVTESETIKLDFPLNQQAFKITKYVPDIKNQAISEPQELITKFENKNMILGALGQVAALTLILTLNRRLFLPAKKSPYKKAKDKILKTYGSIIVEVKDPVLKIGLDIINVKKFAELVDVEEELRIPIIFYENEDKRSGIFSIVHNNIMYQFILTEHVEYK